MLKLLIEEAYQKSPMNTGSALFIQIELLSVSLLHILFDVFKL